MKGQPDRSALRHVHFIAAPDVEPECGDRSGSVTMNAANVGCLRCLAVMSEGNGYADGAR